MVLSNLSIRRPVFATVLMLGLVTLGIASYRRLAVDMMPNVEIPVISIVTLFPGASPETVEREVTRPIEEAVNPIAGVRHVGSTSREGVSQVWIEFELGVRVNDASQEARTKIAAIRGDLPVDIEDPIIDKLDFSALPIVSLAVRSTSLAPRDLSTIADKRIKRRIENISGVGRVDLVGEATREIAVDIDPAQLDALGMGVNEVIAGLRGENVDTPLGRLRRGTGEYALRIEGKAPTVEALATTVISQRAGQPIRLRDVATVRDDVEEQRSLAFINGTPAIALDVLKQSGANTVGVVDAITRELTVLQAELPAGTHVDVVRDGSTFIRESVADVETTVVLGGLLTVLVVFCFLNSWRSTVITGLTLPISVIASFIVMNFGGMTLNTMTLMALSLAIGLLIDDAIVVRENIVRHLERGQDHISAARDGTSEIGLAVTATSLSIIAVFVPVAFMKGIVGRFFFQFGITVAFAVLVSLFVSFTLDPMLSSRWVDPDIARTGRRNLVKRLLDRFNAGFDRAAEGYRAVIGWALDHRVPVVGLATLAFVGGLFAMGLLESEFFPTYDRGEFEVTLQTAPGASIEETRDRLDAAVAALREMPEVEHAYASIGARDADTVRDGKVYVKLVDRGARVRTQEQLQRAARARLYAIAGIKPSLMEAGRFDNRKPLLVNVRGEDLTKLKAYAARLKDALYQVPGLVDLDVTLEHDAPEYRLAIDRERAMDAGLSTPMVAGTIGALVGGQAVSTYEDEEGEARQVRVRLPAAAREDAAQLAALRLAVVRPDRTPALVTLGDVARYRLASTPSEINRRDLSREVVVSANLDGIPLGRAVAAARAIGDRLQVEPGYEVTVGGESEQMEESFAYMAEALILAIVFVYLILAAQFESFVDPLAIMLSLPLSVVGMAGLLFLTGDTINIMSLIGLIMLMGLVTKNAILLVDFAKVLRRQGTPRREALIQAGRTRLRPIVMTTVAMIFGMLPLAFAIGEGAEMRAPMARAVVGGLITSTFLTLLVVPVVYTLLDDVTAWWARLRHHAAPVATGILLVVAVLGGASAARAADPPAPVDPRVFTLDQALAWAGEHSRDVQRAIEYQRWVRAKYLEERAAALPHVEATAGLRHGFDNSQQELYRDIERLFPSGGGSIFPTGQDVRTAEVRVTQVLYTWGQVGAAIRAARIGLEYSEDQLRRFQQAVRRDVSSAFYDVLAARALRDVAADALAQRQRHLAEAERRFAAGTATDYDVLAARVAVDNARPDTIRTVNAVRVARARLKLLLAIDEDVDVDGTLGGAVAPAPDYDAAVLAAIQQRPEIEELRHQQGIAEELVRIAGAGDKPRLEFRGGYGRRSLGVRDIDTNGYTWDAGVYLSFPFFDGFRTAGRVAEARSDVARLGIDRAQLLEAIALDVRVAVDAVQEAGEIVRALAATVEQAERLRLMAEKGYEFGVKTRLDVQDAQVSLDAARATLARAHRDYQVALVTLRWACGTL